MPAWASDGRGRSLGRARRSCFGTPPALSVAGRTDTGVHARGQVVSFSVEAMPELGGFLRSLNGVLPHDVSVVAVEPAADGFDARRDARSRTYCYRVLARAATESVRARPGAVVAHPLRRWRAAIECARLLVGHARLHGVHPTQTEHVRFERDVLAAEWRARAGTCSSSGSRRTPSCVTWSACWSGRCSRWRGAGATSSSSCPCCSGAERSEAGPTAEPHGLSLERVALLRQRVSSRSRAPSPVGSLAHSLYVSCVVDGDRAAAGEALHACVIDDRGVVPRR